MVRLQIEQLWWSNQKWYLCHRTTKPLHQLLAKISIFEDNYFLQIELKYDDTLPSITTRGLHKYIHKTLMNGYHKWVILFMPTIFLLGEFNLFKRHKNSLITRLQMLEIPVIIFHFSCLKQIPKNRSLWICSRSV